MKTIKINAYDYQDLNDNSKINVKIWLDELPFDYEDEDEKGNIIKKLDYPSDWEEIDIKEHCQANGYLFDKYGKCVHQLEKIESEDQIYIETLNGPEIRDNGKNYK